MSRTRNFLYGALMTGIGMSAPTVFADDPNPEPEYKTSTGRELNGPGTHHGEYSKSPADTASLGFDTVQEFGKPRKEIETIPTLKRRKGAGSPVPGVDDKSSTRPGE
jgi:hypothetical protein